LPDQSAGAYDEIMRSLGATAPLLVLALALAVACGGDSDGAGSDSAGGAPRSPDVRGEIRELQTPGPDGTLAAFLVEGSLDAGAIYARAWVRLKESTAIWRRQGASIVEAAAEDLKPGIRVEIKFEGVVAELDPVQATAGEIYILE
jgi:hypothetical protein